MPWKNTPDDRRRSAAAYDARYRRNRDRAMRRDRWRCQLRIPGICIGAASECDHIISRADGGGSDLGNLRAACKPCHQHRTTEQGHAAQRGSSTRRYTQRDPRPRPATRW